MLAIMVAVPFPDPPLSNGAIVLRAWSDRDTPAKRTLGDDPDIVRWTGVPAPYTHEAAHEHLRHVELERLAGRGLYLAIADARTDDLVGSCDVRRPLADDPTLGEVGYLVSPGSRGRGVATGAMALLVAWAIGELAMRRVQALVHPDNPGSTRVLERLGFRREGLLRAYRDGPAGPEDRVVYSVLPGELVDPRCPGLHPGCTGAEGP
jgi:RimJ/RimL family protein N-acetyltransferase